MVREDILGGLKNALERGDTLQEAKDTFTLAGYSKADVEEASVILEKAQTTRKAEIPSLYTGVLQTPEAKPGEKEKPLPQIKVKQKFQWFLVIPIIIVSALIAYLLYSIFLA